MSKVEWFTSTLDCGGISYRASTFERDGMRVTRTVAQVIFSRFNKAAGIQEEVCVHWSQAFKWADADECGGLGLSGVILSDGSKCFASGLYYGTAHKDEYSRENGGLAEVVVGCYGEAWVKRAKRPKRDEHGFPIREPK